MLIKNILIALTSFFLLMIGADRFLNFMEPPCTLMDGISNSVWMFLGVLTIVGGILIWVSALRKYVAGFLIIYMLFYTGVHISKATYDIGGAIFMTVLLGLLLWNPSFIRGKEAAL